jgi:hypothetical protein
MGTFRLEARCWVGEGIAAVETEAVEVASACRGHKAREVATGALALELEVAPLGGSGKDHLDPPAGRGPDAEVHAAVGHHLRADGQPPQVAVGDDRS